VGERQAYINGLPLRRTGHNTVSEAVTFLDVGIQLFVTPYINDEGYVDGEDKTRDKQRT